MELRYSALLFDLDGTLVESITAVNRSWTNWCLSHNLDPEVVLSQIHGRRSIDSIRLVLPHADAEAENERLIQMETEDTEGVVPIDGALEFLAQIPQDQWGVVTSGTTSVANARLKAAAIPEPKIKVFGNEVTNGKPHPEPFLLGATRIAVPPAEIVAFEDTEAGVRSIVEAGMTAISVGRPIEGASYYIENFHQISTSQLEETIWSLKIR